MAPKRKAAAAKSSRAKKSKTDAAETSSPVTQAAAPKAMSVASVWSNSQYVEDGAMKQEGFAHFCSTLGIEELSFDACYLIHLLCPTVDDVMVVCSSKSMFQRAMDSLGCHSVTDLPSKLRLRRAALQRTYGVSDFLPFWKWLFEMGKAIAALNNSAPASAVRTVPLNEGLLFMEAALGTWPLLPKMKEFCEEKYTQPFTKDLWLQIGRFVNLTSVGTLSLDLSNYDDDAAGGGSAWPCMIDDFVEWHRGET